MMQAMPDETKGTEINCSILVLITYKDVIKDAEKSQHLLYMEQFISVPFVSLNPFSIFFDINLFSKHSNKTV